MVAGISAVDDRPMARDHHWIAPPRLIWLSRDAHSVAVRFWAWPLGEWNSGIVQKGTSGCVVCVFPGGESTGKRGDPGGLRVRRPRIPATPSSQKVAF